MGARDEVLTMLREGMTPGEIALERGVTLATILGYLDQLVGRGSLRRSDILFSIPLEQRHAIFDQIGNGRPSTVTAILGRLQRRGMHVDKEDVEVVLRYGDARYALGDMYEDIRTIEVTLHCLIRTSLQEQYGAGEKGWWREGVSLSIRQKCQARREEDLDLATEPFAYTDLLDLRDILDKQWSVLSRQLPPKTEKKALLSDLLRLNQIRRTVMHPVRAIAPTADDFEFVHSLKQRLGFG